MGVIVVQVGAKHCRGPPPRLRVQSRTTTAQKSDVRSQQGIGEQACTAEVEDDGGVSEPA